MEKETRKVTTRIITNYSPSDDAITEIVHCGNVTEIKVLERNPLNNLGKCKRKSKDLYVNTETGEVLEYKHNEKSGNKRNMNKAFEKLRYLINNNFKSDINELHVILTYAEKMDDFDKASKDFKRFWEKVNYKYPDLEYIRIIEPQHTGTWHIHVLIKTAKKGYFTLPKDELEQLWGHGYVWISKIKNNDNVGAYFSACLKDVDVFEKDSENPNDTKCIVKGARLRFYPHNKRFYSYSKGIKKPLTIRTTYGEAKKNYDLEDCVYKKAQEIVLKPDDESEKEKVVNRVLRLQLNSKRKKKS